MSVACLTIFSLAKSGGFVNGVSNIDFTTLLNVSNYTNTGNAGGTFKYCNLFGIKLFWGQTGSLSVSGTGVASSAGYQINFPSGFFNIIQSSTATASGTATNTQYIYIAPNTTPTISGWNLFLTQINGTNGATAGVSVFVVGA